MQKTKTKGLNAFQLKIIALVAMTIDHIAYFIPGVPMFLRIIGRLAAPIFFFLCAETMRHTSSKEKYLLRLYIGSIIMELGKIILAALLSAKPYETNIFATLFFAALVMYSFGVLTDVQGKKAKVYKLAIPVVILAFVVLWSIFYPRIVEALGPMGETGSSLLLAVLPQSPLLVEGGVFWIVMAVGFYLLPGKAGSILLLVFLSGGMFAGIMSTEGSSFQTLFIQNPQWLMVLAIPFIALYNGERGPKRKWLFYAYYPLHIWLLYIIGTLLSK